ncbi:glycosyl hydrolase family 28-related protein [Granulicella sp. 5B5]|uniref:glycosyl hydrolase family 28-related protein n=1 Tax=Granulicella sp. 5B5 TaxID=1617967 RepID=UPI0021034376|nr:glycosyl hydrolase family 28-related protein [Granulicella sp. 5B5]
MPPLKPASVFDVKHHGAKGDGTTIDTPAINRAIETAATAGGGTVLFPAGTYVCYSIRLRSNVALYLDHGDESLDNVDKNRILPAQRPFD